MEFTRDELLAMRADVEADIVDFHATLEWLDAELAALPVVVAVPGKRRYTKLSQVRIREAVQKLQPATPQQLAEYLNCSASSLTMNWLPALGPSGSGMLLKVKTGGKTYYSISKPNALLPPTRSKRRRRRLTLVSGVEHTGRKAPAAVRRRTKPKGVKRQ